MPQVLAGNRLTIPAEYLSGYLRPPQDLIQAEPDVSDAPVWPTPPGFGHLLHETSDIVGDTTTKPSHVRGKVLKKGNKGKGTYNNYQI